MDYRVQKILKCIIRTITELAAILYLYDLILTLFNTPDEITFWGCVMAYIYVVVMINLIEWSMKE